MGLRARGCSVTALATLGALLSPVSVAHAGGGVPVPPTGLHVTAATHTGFTVAVKPDPNAKHFRLYVASKPRALSVQYLHRDKSATSNGPSITIKHLHFRLAVYYYRVVAINGPRKKYSTGPDTASLKPLAPSHLRTSSSSAGSHLTWKSGSETGFDIEQATDPGMTTGKRNYRIRGNTDQFTPYGLTNGTTYYYRVRSLNASTPSGYTSVANLTTDSNEQTVKVMTYNVLEGTDDGRTEGGNVVAPWSQRVGPIAHLVEQGNPDVLGVEEAASFVPPDSKTRQVDSLLQTLGGDWNLANTEIPPTQPHYYRTGVYILYRSSIYKAIGKGGHWNVGNTRWAVYQELQNIATGAKFLDVTAHLRFQPGRASDVDREHETTKMLQDAHKLAARRGGVPIIYDGDFNADQYKVRHAFNGPATVMKAHNVADAWNAAQTRTRTLYDTANNYYTRPLKRNSRIDYVWAPPGIGVESWGQVLDLHHGKFVGAIPSDHNPVFSTLTFPY